MLTACRWGNEGGAVIKKKKKIVNKAEALILMVLTSDFDQTSSKKECQKINKNPKKNHLKWLLTGL
jgi:hypothetical protein